MEYVTYRFDSTPDGLRKKAEVSTRMTKEGYTISSELIEQGHIKREQACCLGAICLPTAFLAGRTASVISVTYQRESFSAAAESRSVEATPKLSLTNRVAFALGKMLSKRNNSIPKN